MDLVNKKYEQWTIETAQMKHTARKFSMSSVAQTFLRKRAAVIGLADYQAFLASVRDDSTAYESATEEERDFYDIASSVGLWSMVCACVKPYISLDQWLMFGEQTVQDLSGIVEEINPHWFTTPDQEKKTDELPPQSISE